MCTGYRVDGQSTLYSNGRPTPGRLRWAFHVTWPSQTLQFPEGGLCMHPVTPITLVTPITPVSAYRVPGPILYALYGNLSTEYSVNGVHTYSAE